MPRELEAKFRLDDPGELRRRLRRLGATNHGRVFEDNQIFDTPGGRLRRAGCGLRVRQWRRSGRDAATGATLTFKGPRSGPFKARQELETTVGEARALLDILARLGFVMRLAYEKRRETWHCGRCEVVLDELPRLGWFVEIEGPSGRAIEDVRARLGLAEFPLVSETYPQLTARHGIRVRRGVRRLAFRKG